MKAEFFKAVCPLEIGDTVAIKVSKDGETKEALYMPTAIKGLLCMQYQ